MSGSYAGKELYFDILSGDLAAPDDVRYKFQFRRAQESAFPWVKFKDLVFSQLRRRELIDTITEGQTLDTEQEDRVGDNIDLVDRAFKSHETITTDSPAGDFDPTTDTIEQRVERYTDTDPSGTRHTDSRL